MLSGYLLNQMSTLFRLQHQHNFLVTPQSACALPNKEVKKKTLMGASETGYGLHLHGRLWSVSVELSTEAEVFAR